MGNAVSAVLAAVIGVDSVEEGFYPDRVDVVDLRIENANDHDLHLDTIKMTYHIVARHDRYSYGALQGDPSAQNPSQPESPVKF